MGRYTGVSYVEHAKTGQKYIEATSLFKVLTLDAETYDKTGRHEGAAALRDFRDRLSKVGPERVQDAQD